MMNNAFRPKISDDEWQLILSALKPYRHNVQYRELLERLEYQAEALCARRLTGQKTNRREYSRRSRCSLAADSFSKTRHHGHQDRRQEPR